MLNARFGKRMFYKTPVFVRYFTYVKRALMNVQEQDKSSDIEQQPSFGDRKISNIQPQKRGGYKTNRNII